MPSKNDGGIKVFLSDTQCMCSTGQWSKWKFGARLLAKTCKTKGKKDCCVINGHNIIKERQLKIKVSVFCFPGG